MVNDFEIFDFHTHVFPDAIAPRAIAGLEQTSGMIAQTDGTKNGLLDAMQASGTDYAVILPVATKASQFESVNRFAKELDTLPNITCFAGFHPDCEQPEQKLTALKQAGFKGIKLHPDYHDCFADDARYVRIVDCCIDLGLYVTFHAGYDPLSPNTIHADTEHLCRLLDAVHAEQRPTQIILAHLGSFKHPERSLNHLVGRNVFFDTSCYAVGWTAEQIKTLIARHGADKILYATDTPWSNMKASIAFWLALDIGDDVRRQILSGNAKRLLGL